MKSQSIFIVLLILVSLAAFNFLKDNKYIYSAKKAIIEYKLIIAKNFKPYDRMSDKKDLSSINKIKDSHSKNTNPKQKEKITAKVKKYKFSKTKTRKHTHGRYDEWYIPVNDDSDGTGTEINKLGVGDLTTKQ